MASIYLPSTFVIATWLLQGCCRAVVWVFVVAVSPGTSYDWVHKDQSACRAVVRWREGGVRKASHIFWECL